MVIWITGLSGSGKTTLCEMVKKLVGKRLTQLVALDGDVIREVFGNELGFKEADRVVQISRLQRLAKILSDQGLVVLVGALYAHPNLLDWNRENIDDYFEVYIDAPIEVVRDRDPKGLYAKVLAGLMPDVVGVDIPWHTPQKSNLVLHANNEETPTQSALHLIKAVPVLLAALE